MTKRSYYSSNIQSFLSKDNYSIFGEITTNINFLLKIYKRICGTKKLKF